MVLTAAGPLVAILNRQDDHHQRCVNCLPGLSGPMITTWPAFTEAMYLLGECGWKERNNWKRIFTLDTDFLIYRSRGKELFELIPSPEQGR